VSTVEVAVIGGRRWVASAPEARPSGRGTLRILAFAGLSLYGVLRWGTLLTPTPMWRLLGMFAVAVTVAAAGSAVVRQTRAAAAPAAAVIAVLALLAMLAIAGVPIRWLTHVRIAVTADGIWQGVTALPDALVPYIGINEWVRVVIVLGAGVLMLDAALLLAFIPSGLGDLRRAGAAVPLIVLAVVPSTLARPGLPFLHGLLLFVLLALFVWGERIPRHDAGTALGVAALAAIGALALAPGLDRHHPWINYQALTGKLSATKVDIFDWSQHYGPLNWPRVGREVLDVKAQHPDYWKAANLDLFNGVAWAQGTALLGSNLPPPDPAVQADFTQTVQVTLRALRTKQVIAAGTAAEPQHLGQLIAPAASVGTWTVNSPLGPGDSYTVTTYSPHPTGAQLSASTAGESLQVQAGDYTAIDLPQAIGTQVPPVVAFPPFHSGAAPRAVVSGPGADAGAVLAYSPYAPAYTLAQHLASTSATPYQFVQSVLRYLGHGFTYDEHPPRRAYPLESFLFTDRRGYCQQFAGAMALLLRMGGVPARVATGFTTGTFDSTKQEYVVTDQDAHAWVEAWFPSYGWVRFDPTPAVAPARGGIQLGASVGAADTSSGRRAPFRRRDLAGAVAATTGGAQSHGGGSSVPLYTALAALGAALVAAALWFTRGSVMTAEQRLAELERAFARAGRPLSPQVTLQSLEQRLRSSPAAAAYIRAMRLQRFGGGEERPHTDGRRALRAALGQGLGAVGRLRALWALPPRRV
jgi:transglutaminase-like putative cysteine protease